MQLAPAPRRRPAEGTRLHWPPARRRARVRAASRRNGRRGGSARDVVAARILRRVSRGPVGRWDRRRRRPPLLGGRPLARRAPRSGPAAVRHYSGAGGPISRLREIPCRRREPARSRVRAHATADQPTPWCPPRSARRVPRTLTAAAAAGGNGARSIAPSNRHCNRDGTSCMGMCSLRSHDWGLPVLE